MERSSCITEWDERQKGKCIASFKTNQSETLRAVLRCFKPPAAAEAKKQDRAPCCERLRMKALDFPWKDLMGQPCKETPPHVSCWPAGLGLERFHGQFPQVAEVSSCAEMTRSSVTVLRVQCAWPGGSWSPAGRP